MTTTERQAQQRAVAKRVEQTGEQVVDALTAIQIERAAGLTDAELVTEMLDLVAPAVKGRRRVPGFVRRRAGIDVVMGSIDERWTLDYFLGRRVGPVEPRTPPARPSRAVLSVQEARLRQMPI